MPASPPLVINLPTPKSPPFQKKDAAVLLKPLPQQKPSKPSDLQLFFQEIK